MDSKTHVVMLAAQQRHGRGKLELEQPEQLEQLFVSACQEAAMDCEDLVKCGKSDFAAILGRLLRETLGVMLMKYSIFQEEHASGERHYYFPVLADRPVSSLGLGRLSDRCDKAAWSIKFHMRIAMFWTERWHLSANPLQLRAVLAAAKSNESVFQYVCRYQSDLEQKIRFAWEIHDAPDEVAHDAMSNWDCVLAAREKPCVCHGRWVNACAKCLTEGRGKYNNVYIYGPRFGAECYVKPVGVANSFPLQSIFDKRIMVLQDLRVDSLKLSFDALLVLLEGQALEVPLPRNHFAANKVYTGTAGCFATSGNKLRIPHCEAVKLNVLPAEQDAMMDARWQYFRFDHAFSAVDIEKIEACASCYANWVSAGLPAVQRELGDEPPEEDEDEDVRWGL
ncbi:unnamed protein product [Symbiodinium sp. CCMP2592]|nr:unnamed protein product [Symbiodinium sp. CCMP2592]